jgi:enoyl-CoA hydratase
MKLPRGDDSVTALLDITVEDGIGVVAMNHAPVNSITETFATQLMETVGEISRDDAVRVVIITSALKGIFMAGADIKMLREAVKANDFSRLNQAAVIKPAFNAIQDMPKPVIAAINGHALGGGCELALACDYRVIAKGCRIGLTEVLLGLIPAAGGTQRIVRMVPRPLATRLLLEGSQLNSDEAKEAGLVDLVVADKERVLDEAREFAGRFARGPTRAYAALKRCMNEGGDMDFKAGLELEKQIFFKLLESEDAREGLTAFLEKRKPTFKGR